MNPSAIVTRAAVDAGITLWSGVPCSSMGELFAEAGSNASLRYVPAANEGDAVAIAVGAWLGGTTAGAVLLQNSGLGNAINPLTSLVDAIKAPLLLFVGWRGGPRTPDEPQHELMGLVTEQMLALCRITSFRSGESVEELTRATKNAVASVNRGQAAAVLVETKLLGASKPDVAAAYAEARRPTVELDFRRFENRPSRSDLIKAVLRLAPSDAAIVSTTGKCSRELFALGHSPRNFYQVGAMGCVSSVGLGLALTSNRGVIVLDGDGAALMRLGAMATIAQTAGPDFLHVVLDNEVHDSTGGQPTSAGAVDLAGVATACGYRQVIRCDTLETFVEGLQWGLERGGPTLLHAKMSVGSMSSLGRPTQSPVENAIALRTWLRAKPEPVTA